MGITTTGTTIEIRNNTYLISEIAGVKYKDGWSTREVSTNGCGFISASNMV